MVKPSQQPLPSLKVEEVIPDLSVGWEITSRKRKLKGLSLVRPNKKADALDNAAGKILIYKQRVSENSETMASYTQSMSVNVGDLGASPGREYVRSSLNNKRDKYWRLSLIG